MGYEKGKSCKQLGGKHHFVKSKTGHTMRCSKCHSVRGVKEKGKKGKSKAKVAPRVAKQAPSEPVEQETEGL